MKHYLKKTFLYHICKFLFYTKIVKPYMIIRMDGGICSQMHQYLIGYVFQKKGFIVKYDLSWYKEFGMDLNHKDVRNFDLLKAFPGISFKETGGFILYLYRHFFNHQGSYPKDLNTDWTNLTPPKLLSGYYASPNYLYSTYFNTVFIIENKQSVLDAPNYKIYQEICPNTSAAVHVRRGDLAVEVSNYGAPASLEYFMASIDYLKKVNNIHYFYLFSDDKLYLAEKLLPFVGLKRNEYLIVNNGADKGYMDMVLMSRCDNIVTSKGSLGKYAALLDLNKRRKVLVCKDDKQTFMLNVRNIEKIVI